MHGFVIYDNFLKKKVIFLFDVPSFLGTKAYDKLKLILSKKSLVNGIRQLSPHEQTSCLEGFHSTLNQWHPKMLCFSWMGTYCR